MFRISLLMIGVVALLSSVVGAAASLNVTADRLGSGSVPVATCGDTSPAAVSYTQSAGKVTHASVANLPATCNGGALTVTLTNIAGSAVGTGTATVASGAANNIVIAAQPSSTAVAAARVLIEGP